MQVVWNGDLTEEFQLSRGIRQWNPQSPYIFVLYMERLSHLIEHEVSKRTWLPIRLRKIGPPIAHGLFADNLTLFAETDLCQVDMILSCLARFCNSSG